MRGQRPGRRALRTAAAWRAWWRRQLSPDVEILAVLRDLELAEERLAWLLLCLTPAQRDAFYTWDQEAPGSAAHTPRLTEETQETR